MNNKGNIRGGSRNAVRGAQLVRIGTTPLSLAYYVGVVISVARAMLALCISAYCARWFARSRLRARAN